jgi:hypothetical protein
MGWRHSLRTDPNRQRCFRGNYCGLGSGGMSIKPNTNRWSNGKRNQLREHLELAAHGSSRGK